MTDQSKVFETANVSAVVNGAACARTLFSFSEVENQSASSAYFPFDQTAILYHHFVLVSTVHAGKGTRYLKGCCVTRRSAEADRKSCIFLEKRHTLHDYLSSARCAHVSLSKENNAFSQFRQQKKGILLNASGFRM